MLDRFKLDYGPAAQAYCLKEYGLPQSENAECDQKVQAHPRIAEMFLKLMGQVINLLYVRSIIESKNQLLGR